MLDVALTPAGLRRCDVAVVVDVLRATSTITQALASGYRSVQCADSIDRARELRGADCALAGEQRCVKPQDFDLDNSPVEATRCYADRLVLATTNGAPAIVAATRLAPTVLLASVLNLRAVLGVLRDRDWPERDVQVVCSGTGGAPALEDAYLAGRLCARLPGPRSDAARLAQALAAAHPSAGAALACGAHAATLRAAGLEDDIAFCARESVLDVVPLVVATTAGAATVVDLRAAAGTVGDVPPSAVART
jgi:2-phosphosulfolactate phosphatase